MDPVRLLANGAPGAVVASFLLVDSSPTTLILGALLSEIVMYKYRAKLFPHLSDFGLLAGSAAYPMAVRRRMAPSNALFLAAATTLIASFIYNDDEDQKIKQKPNGPVLNVPGSDMKDYVGLSNVNRAMANFSLFGNQSDALQERRDKMLFSSTYDQAH